MFSIISGRVHCNFLCAALLSQVSSSQAQGVKTNQSWGEVEKPRERAWVGVGVCSGRITTQGKKFLCLTYSYIVASTYIGPGITLSALIFRQLVIFLKLAVSAHCSKRTCSIKNCINIT